MSVLYLILGGGGQRKLLVIPPDSDGYNGNQLKSVSGNGKSTMYIVPLKKKTWHYSFAIWCRGVGEHAQSTMFSVQWNVSSAVSSDAYKGMQGWPCHFVYISWWGKS